MSDTPQRRATTPEAILQWCSDVAPLPWFPSEQSQRDGTPRDDFDEPITLLRREGRIRVSDWVKGKGQGFTIAEVEALPEPKREIPVISTTYDRGERARTALLSVAQRRLTTSLLLLNTLWFLVGASAVREAGGDLEAYLRGSDAASLHRWGAVDGISLLQGEWWRLLACVFVHVGAIHLALNMLSLMMLGPVAESWWGETRFLAIYLISGVVGSVAMAAYRPLPGGAGASGALCGLQGALVVWLLIYKGHIPETLVRPILRLFLFNIAIIFLIGFRAGISWEAHLAGGLAGACAGYGLDKWRPEESRRTRRFGMLILLLLLSVTAGGFWLASSKSLAWKRVRILVWSQQTAEKFASLSKFLSSEFRPELIQDFHTQVVQASITQSDKKRGGLQKRAQSIRAALGLWKEQLANDQSEFRPACEIYAENVSQFLDLSEKILASRTVPASEWHEYLARRDKVLATVPTRVNRSE